MERYVTLASMKQLPAAESIFWLVYLKILYTLDKLSTIKHQGAILRIIVTTTAFGTCGSTD